MTFPSDRFCWFEYVSKDSAKAQGFFGELFNWKTKAVPMPGGDYTMIAIGDHTIGGYLATPKGAPEHPHWLSHLQVENADATAKKAVAAGGKLLKQVSDRDGMGTWAVIGDPYGAPFALWQPAKAEAAEYRGVAGAFCWNELYTDHPEKSVAFYEAIGGLRDRPMDMGPMGTYHVLASHGKDRGGITKSPMPGIPQHWMPYVQVASVDQTIAKAKRLGCDVKLAGQDVPNVGRLGVFLDPLGASIGILQPA
jgi:predicted enzyme related to lactoylglutathione lyase